MRLLTQCIGLSPTGPGIHHPDGTQDDHALTIKLDQSDEAAQGGDDGPREGDGNLRGQPMTADQIQFATEQFDYLNSNPSIPLPTTAIGVDLLNEQVFVSPW
ncbi:hypothetical protein [Actibacterium sp. XHP0104]|uniref:hypothetical protein n=1 Tax=Actibacterium sp. XHP0104 TaxID=2984335 RepID=UPI0021E78046|nr:hypothetical protein [Actibacterium sp. XHP0104]MCV2883068.1 hypothetical protein [Actibacterium sp. XHP0104]